MPSPLPIPVASFLTDSGGVESGAISASYPTPHNTALTVDTSKITLAPSTSLWFTISNQKPFPKTKPYPFGPVLFKGQEVLHTTEIWHLEKLGVFRRSWGGGEAHHF